MDKNNESISESRINANSLLVTGASAGATGAAGALITGAVCPSCIIATPVLLGVGLLKRMKLNREQNTLREVEP